MNNIEVIVGGIFAVSLIIALLIIVNYLIIKVETLTIENNELKKQINTLKN